MNNNENFDLMNNISSKFTLSSSIKDNKKYKYKYYENFTFLMKEIDSRKYIIKVFNKLT